MKKIFTILAAVLFSATMFAEKTLYFNSGSWASEPGRFAIYCISNESWSGLEALEEANLYSVKVADEVTQVVFCRMNPELEKNEWASLWNQTEDLTIPEGKDLYTITGWGEGHGAKATGAWSKYGELPKVQIAGEWAIEGEGEDAKWVISDLKVADDKKTASIKINIEMNDKNGYAFKMLIDGKWMSLNGEGEWYTLKREWPGVKGLKENQDNFWLSIDVAGEYVFTWTFANDSLGIQFPAEPELKHQNGFYLIGRIDGKDGWDIEGIADAHLFVKNEAAEGEEYSLKVELKENDEIQAVRVDKDKLGAWYPGGDGNNLKVDAAHAGKVTIYFRPNKDGGDDWHHKCLYISKDATGIDNTAATVKAVKVVRDGQMFIEMNGVLYTLQGAIVK